MQVIFGYETAEQVSERYTVLQLETFNAEGQEIPAFCVVPAEKIPVEDLGRVDELSALHQEFIDNFNVKNFKICEDLYSKLHGRWSGELDSFYDTILNKINSSST